MSPNTPPVITFRASVTTTASPEGLYDVLADLRSHLEWAGGEGRPKKFKLLRLDAPPGPATVGVQFSSSGANTNGTFHDRSTVVVADPGAAFGFDTESTLDRKHGKTWHVRCAHRYVIERSAGGAVVRYTCEMWPQNYVPYWLKRGIQPGTRLMMQPLIRKHMERLAAMAESGARQQVSG